MHFSWTRKGSDSKPWCGYTHFGSYLGRTSIQFGTINKLQKKLGLVIFIYLFTVPPWGKRTCSCFEEKSKYWFPLTRLTVKHIFRTLCTWLYSWLNSGPSLTSRTSTSFEPEELRQREDGGHTESLRRVHDGDVSAPLHVVFRFSSGNGNEDVNKLTIVHLWWFMCRNKISVFFIITVSHPDDGGFSSSNSFHLW